MRVSERELLVGKAVIAVDVARFCVLIFRHAASFFHCFLVGLNNAVLLLQPHRAAVVIALAALMAAPEEEVPIGWFGNFHAGQNQWHFFGFTGWLATRMHVADPLLRLVREEKAISEYHCPTTYRINTVRCATRHLDAAGFTSVEFRMWDLPAMYEPYLPGRLSAVAGGWHAMAYRTGNPQLMGHLTFRAVR